MPIVALTAQASREDQQRCLEAGMNGFVTKPLRSRRLLSAIDRALGEPGSTAPGGLDHQTDGDELETLESESTLPDDRLPARAKIDWEKAAKVAGGSQELLDRLVAAAAREVPKLFALCEQAIVTGERAEIRRCSHSLKSSAGYFGVPALISGFAELERESSELALESLRVRLNALKPLVDEFVSELGSELHSKNTGIAGNDRA